MEPDRGDKAPEQVAEWEARDKDVEVDADWEEEIRPVREPEETAYVLHAGRRFRIRSGWPVIACPAQSAGRRWFGDSSYSLPGHKLRFLTAKLAKKAQRTAEYTVRHKAQGKPSPLPLSFSAVSAPPLWSLRLESAFKEKTHKVTYDENSYIER